VREDVDNLDNMYKLHVLKTGGPSLVHVTLRTRPEIIVFGEDQEFSVPMNASAGKHIVVVAQPGASTATLVRLEAGKPDQKKEVSLRVADVVRAANELGATYPDILQLLADASKQKNLPTSLATDKLPEAARVYYRPSSDGKKGQAKPVKIGREKMSPNAFPAIEDPEEAARHRQQAARDAKIESEGSMASVPSEPSDTDSSAGADPQPVDKNKANSKKKSTKPKSSWSWFGNKK
jgi:hypothetical protein